MSNIIRLPGIVDIHAHLRDPGQTHKEDFFSGTKAALAGGITTVFDMPNNIPPIFSSERLKIKEKIAERKAVCDYGFYFGSDGRNLKEFKNIVNRVVGLKIYLNETTGKCLLEDSFIIEKVFYAWPKDKVIVAHAQEDKVDLVIDLCRKYKNKTHLTHISDKKTLIKIIDAKYEGLNISCDVTPHHLFLTKEDIPYLDNLILVKPALGSEDDVNFLWDNISFIDCIASDHAPHTLSEKKSFDPPSGMPGFETLLPLLLTMLNKNKISIDELIRLTSQNAQKIFQFRQAKDSFVEVDMEKEYKIDNSQLFTKCGWSPYHGWKVMGKVDKVFIRGKKVFEYNKILVKKGFGKNIFN